MKVYEIIIYVFIKFIYINLINYVFDDLFSLYISTFI